MEQCYVIRKQKTFYAGYWKRDRYNASGENVDYLAGLQFWASLVLQQLIVKLVILKFSSTNLISKIC